MVDQGKTTDPDDELFLTVGGREFSGWEKVRVERALDSASGQFQLTASSEGGAFPIKPGELVQVRIGRPSTYSKVQATRPARDALLEILATGQVDLLRASLGPSTRTFTLGGRDATADLVDCSATNQPGEWFGIGLEDLVRQIAAPFGVRVFIDDRIRELPSPLLRPDAQVRPFDVFALNQGEKAWEAIERACRARALLCYGRGDGGLQISLPAEARAQTALVEGENVLEATLNYSLANRFQTYIVRGQRQGDDSGWGAAVAQIEGRALDRRLRRFRPLIVMAEGIVTEEDAQVRAIWEGTNRAARAATLKVTVQGVRQIPGGRPWTVNELVPCRIPSLRVNSDLLVASTLLSRGSQGTRTELEFVRPDAFEPQPEIPTEDDWEGVFAGEDFDDGEDY